MNTKEGRREAYVPQKGQASSGGGRHQVRDPMSSMRVINAALARANVTITEQKGEIERLQGWAYMLNEEIKQMRLEIQRIRAVKNEAIEQKEQFLRSISDYKKENDRLKAQLAAMKGKGKRYAE